MSIISRLVNEFGIAKNLPWREGFNIDIGYELGITYFLSLIIHGVKDGALLQLRMKCA
ncbi:protein of unknown function [Candidatus Nitrosocaldus cavascurensis]|jgi:hypothetical protein|uniref:Uncharacterized protein n=1 Tax=Candidatus Nitrosocaldus cavascurensis TaxID=2058097 RepID=A0A2K5AQR4_9ARCH|nr:protein of unknown function [Candidatus Nitrosocaldus cavascurensis]